MFGRSVKQVMVLATIAWAGASRAAAQTAQPSDSYDELYARYLKEARAAVTRTPQDQAWSWMSSLALDRRAHTVNDLVTIRVVESITGGFFRGKVLEQIVLNGKGATMTQVTGSAHITGLHQFVMDSDDRLRNGFLIKEV